MSSQRRKTADLKTRVERAFSGAGKKVEATGEKIGRSLQDKGLQEDAEKIISYLNDEVVPAIRSHSTQALRSAAQKLSQFADYMDRRR
ncbi:MAG TPA: hypothetical protein VKT29_01575 [Terriglobales bacterium]|nr:hypothetical protein [Terriglobales bacterium]